MPSRSVRRKAHKRLARALQASEAPHSALSYRWLAYWQAQPWRRASRLGAPAAWGLLGEPKVGALLKQLDATGELRAELARLIAEAVTRASDPRLVRGCRPASLAVKSRG